MKQIALALIFLASATAASAESFMVQGKVTRVDPNWQKIQTSVPFKECSIVEVPVYGQTRQDTGGAIVGGIIGGVIGNQIGKGSGNDVATGVGAITGAIIGGRGRDEIVGYRQEERCIERVRTTYEDKIMDYTVFWNWNGYKGTFYSKRVFQVGDTVTLDLNINPSR